MVVLKVAGEINLVGTLGSAKKDLRPESSSFVLVSYLTFSSV